MRSGAGLAGVGSVSALFVVCAALGGVTRFLAEYYLPPVGSSGFPRATLLVNTAGSFILGLVWNAPGDARLVAGTAFCGALTTFSGVALQLMRRARAGSTGQAITYAVVTVALGIAAATVGLRISGLLFS